MNNISMEHLLSQLRETASLAGNNKLPDSEVNNHVNFTEALSNAINSVNDIQQQAGQLSDAYVSGDKSIDLAQVMVAGQKANISFEAMVQVRNKLVSAYQEIMNMQI
jgi:flagellar hook-basal body complex protein FliE